MVPKNDKNETWHMYNIHIMVAYVYHSMSFVAYCLSACEGERALAPQLLAICLSLGCCVPNSSRPVSAGFYALSFGSLMHLKCCICFTETERNPFSSSIVFAQSLTCVFFSLSGKSQDSPNTAQGADKKVLFGGENKVF